jgi:hypothetical protein
MLSSASRHIYLREMGYQPLRLRAQAPAASTSPTADAPPATPGAPRAVVDPLWAALLAAAAASGARLTDLGWEERLAGPAFDFDGPTLRINPIALRQQPAAKRALWKTLRSLRARRLRGA